MALEGHFERHILRSVDTGDVGRGGLGDRWRGFHRLAFRDSDTTAKSYAKRNGC